MEPIAVDNPFDPDTPDTHDVAIKRGSAMAYVWGRQDGGDSERDTGYSQAFASVYALAHRLTDGYGVGPLQSAHHEWTVTGRIVIITFDRRILAVQVPEGAPDTTRAVAYPVPWVGDWVPHWHGLVRRPTDAVHVVQDPTRDDPAVLLFADGSDAKRYADAAGALDPVEVEIIRDPDVVAGYLADV